MTKEDRSHKSDKEPSKHRHRNKGVNVGNDEDAGADASFKVTELESEEDSDERQLQRQLRKAKKAAKHLERLGLDENGDELDNFSLTKYPVREWKFTIPGMRDHIALNPAVTLIAIAIFWGLAFWCNYDSVFALAKLNVWHSVVSLNFTWLFVGTKPLCFFFMLYITYKYGHIHLGNKHDKPEFSTLAYSSMIFLVCTANALIDYSVMEPMSFRDYHFYATTGYRSQDEIDMFAINLAVTDWGIGGWATTTVVAVAMSLATHRFRLPATYRSCFYAILGSYTWGWIGDVIDGLAIVSPMVAIFASLGGATSSILSGLKYLNWIEQDSTDEQVLTIQNMIIWVLTIVSLLSVVAGLHGGIKVLASLTAVLAIALLLLVFVMDDTKYILNLQVQEAGSYLQSSIFQLNFWTDAFGHLREGSGRAVDGKASELWWFSSYFNFTQSWWIASSAMNGPFIASISRGRKLWELVAYTLVIPILYIIVWFCVWGGVGMRQSRQALELETLGETHYNNSEHFLSNGNEICYDVPQEDILVDGVVVFTNYLLGVTPVCKFDEENAEAAIYNVLNSFSFPQTFRNGGFGPLLSYLSMIVCGLLYMVTAGATSLTIDKMASSGRKNNHLARRMFWLVSVGVLSSIFLSTGGGDALEAIQAAIIICGLSSAVLLCFVMQSVTLLCRQAVTRKVGDYQFPNQPVFDLPVYGGIMNVFEYLFSLGNVNQARVDERMGHTTSVQVTEFLKGLVVPFVSLKLVLDATFPQNCKANAVLVGCYTICYALWVGLYFASFWWIGLTGSICLVWAIHGGILAMIRSNFRSRYNIRSNIVADMISSALLWPQVLSQMRMYDKSRNKHEVPNSSGETTEIMQ